MSSNSRRKKKKLKFNLKNIFSKSSSNNIRKEKTKSTKKKKKKLRKILTVLLALAIAFVFACAAFLLYIVISTKSFDPNALLSKDQTVLYDKDGNEFATLGIEKRESIEYDQLPQVLIDAIIATEDSRFYQHNGVDTARFLKASFLQLLGQSDAGGASTLTMQVVKNNLTSTTSSGISGIIRKFKDVYISVFFMEKKYSKEEILEFYVNDNYLSDGIYGVEEASKYYFGKEVAELSLPEAALIAGMFQSPNRYNPYKNPEGAYNRRDTVLKLMVRHGYITEEERKMANDVSIESMLVGTKADTNYQGYIDTVIDEIENLTGDNPAVVPMKIYTALDRKIQDGINDVLNGTSYKNWVDDDIQAGIAITNVNDGTIVAIGAGRNREGERSFNYATQSHRQPGSTAKPLFDYGPGFEFNEFSTGTLINDEPWTYTNGPAVNNWDGGYHGLITLKQALSVSRNVPALKAFQQVDKKNIVSFVRGLGLDVAYSTKDDNYKVYATGADNLINEAYSIGGMSYGVSPLDMAEAYACFANGGYHIEAHAVTKIEYRETGKVRVSSEEEKYKKEPVMKDSTAYLMNNVLKYAVDYQFNGGAKMPGYTVAAKTGTSNLDSSTIKKYGLPGGAVADLWTVAYTPEYSVALWYGYKEVDSTHYLSGASAPKDDVMRAVIKTVPMTTKNWEQPSSVVQVTIEKDTAPALLPSEYTPDNMKTTEYFTKGSQPTEVSQRYAKLPAVTNLKATKTNDKYKITWNFKTPEILTTEYLSKYFSYWSYGNSSASKLSERTGYIKNNFGFGIYKKTTSGALELVEFVSGDKNEYIYSPTTSGNIELVVKAEYKDFKANASDNVSVTIKSDVEPVTKELEVSLKDNKLTAIFPKGTYKDTGITVKYNGKEVGADIKYTINTEEFNDLDSLVEYVNKITETKEITIKYSATYNNETKSTTRKVNIEGD